MKNKKVLVIDDEDFIRELVKDFLQLEKIQCDGADTAAEGLNAVTRDNYNLILLDRNLGKSKAEDVIEKIHQIDRKVPIVILTGDADCDEEYLKKVGAEGIVFKPFQVADFMRKIRYYLEIE